MLIIGGVQFLVVGIRTEFGYVLNRDPESTHVYRSRKRFGYALCVDFAGFLSLFLSFKTCLILWMDGIRSHHFEIMVETMICCCFFYRGTIIPSFVGWCEMDFIHPQRPRAVDPQIRHLQTRFLEQIVQS